jgi:hypothetical protein
MRRAIKQFDLRIAHQVVRAISVSGWLRGAQSYQAEPVDDKHP